MKSAVIGIALLAGGLSLAPPAGAAVQPAVDVPAMVQASDLIVVGRAERTTVERRGGHVGQAIHVSVARVLKRADTPAPARLLVRLDLAASGYDLGHDSVADRQYGIFFLQRSHLANVYTATDPHHPVLVAAPGRGTATTGDPLADIAHELTRVLATTGAVLTDARHGVQKLPLGTPAEQAEHVYQEAAAALRSIPYAQSGSPLGALADSDHVAAKLLAIACLLQARGPDGLLPLKTRYLESAAPYLMNPASDLAPAVSALAQAIEGNVATPGAARTLSVLLGSDDTAVRAAAASALAAIARAR